MRKDQVDMKKIIALLFILTLVFPLLACIGAGSTGAVSAYQSESGLNGADGTSVDIKQNSDLSWDSIRMSSIILKGDSIALDGSGGIVDGNRIAITSAGIYSISGTLDDGQIIVKTEDKETVTLILNGVDITCSTGAPIYIDKAKNTVITLAGGTENYVTDGSSYVFADSTSDEPNAAVFSKDDLVINGNGSLTVNANYNNGIQSKDDLEITGGNIIVNAVNDGIRGRDSITVRDANISVKAGGDGMQSNNDEDVQKGYVDIAGGVVNINAAKDGIQAETRVFISSGDITVSSGGGSVNGIVKTGMAANPWENQQAVNTSDSSSSSFSAKGIKAGTDITIDGGNIKIDSADDSIHSNGSLAIDGGIIVLASGDDGIHSDSSLEINGGDVRIKKSYEGIESAIVIINNGDIHVVASDDGVNVAGGNDGSSIDGRPGQNAFESSGNNYLNINGGYTIIDAAGDGLDVNGTISMTGGLVIVNGPTANDNGALDHSGFVMTGGFLLAAGSSGMAQAPDTTSTQYAVIMNLSSAQPADALIHIETTEGEAILTFAPSKTYQSVVLSSSKLKNSTTYIVYCGGRSTGTALDGLYAGGTYTPGTQVASFTVSSIVTSIGSTGGGFPGGGRR